jgi:hypothetical protein
MKNWGSLKNFALSLAALVVLALPARADEYEPATGDVVFQSLGHSPLIDMIEGSTTSPYSHCGIVVSKSGRWMVLEAIGPVRETPLEQWVQHGRKEGFAAYRLKPGFAGRREEFVHAAYNFIGKPYDIRYDLDDEKIYCSELVFKAFRAAFGQDLGRLVSLRELNWRPYEKLIRQIEGGAPPLERQIITPGNLARAPQLERIYSRDIAADAVDKNAGRLPNSRGKL